MNFKEFSSALASSLHDCNWAYPELKQHLERRLPLPERQAAISLAKKLLQEAPKSYAPDLRRLTVLLASFPETRKLYSFAGKHQSWPLHSLAPTRFSPSPSFENLTIPNLSCEGNLADWLSLDQVQLCRFADLKGLSNGTPNAFAPHYRFHLRTKKNGGLRLIEEPKPFLKHLQRRIVSGILNRVPASDAAYGFVPGRNCIQAAAKHAGEEAVVSFDMQDFFPSIRMARIHGMFRCLGYPQAVAQTLAGLCTLKTPPRVRARLKDQQQLLCRRHLPQGAPASPALANLCCYNLDRRLSALAQSLGASFSRYADDLTFSGDRSVIRPLLRTVPAIASDEGFRLNAAKTRVALSHQAQTCTGLTVNQKVNIPRREYDRLKSAIHHLNEPDNRSPAALDQLSGRIAWAESVNPSKGAKLRERFDAALSAVP